MGRAVRVACAWRMRARMLAAYTLARARLRVRRACTPARSSGVRARTGRRHHGDRRRRVPRARVHRPGGPCKALRSGACGAALGRRATRTRALRCAAVCAGRRRSGAGRGRDALAPRADSRRRCPRGRAAARPAAGAVHRLCTRSSAPDTGARGPITKLRGGRTAPSSLPSGAAWARAWAIAPLGCPSAGRARPVRHADGTRSRCRPSRGPGARAGPRRAGLARAFGPWRSSPGYPARARPTLPAPRRRRRRARAGYPTPGVGAAGEFSGPVQGPADRQADRRGRDRPDGGVARGSRDVRPGRPPDRLGHRPSWVPRSPTPASPPSGPWRQRLRVHPMAEPRRHGGACGRGNRRARPAHPG